jgi:hypothetical protein
LQIQALFQLFVRNNILVFQGTNIVNQNTRSKKTGQPDEAIKAYNYAIEINLQHSLSLNNRKEGLNKKVNPIFRLNSYSIFIYFLTLAR